MTGEPETRPFVLRLLRSRAFQAAVGVCVLAYLILHGLDALGGPEGVRERFGWMAPAVTVPVHALISLTPFPSDVFAIANGAVYGLVLGSVLSWLGWWVAALAEYGIALRARRDFDLDVLMSRLPEWIQRWPIDHPAFLILSRLIPYAGGHVSTLLPGAAGVPFLRVVWCQAIGIIPGAIFMAAVGVGLVAL